MPEPLPPGKLTANCYLLSGYLAGSLRDGHYRPEGYETESGRLIIKSEAGNLFTVEVRQVAGTE